MKPLHWIGTVKVYLDQGNLNVGIDCVRNPATYECELDANGEPTYPVLDQQDGDDLVAATVADWSGVPTSSFRATVAGRAPVDINGANFTDYIAMVPGAPPKYNGGGIQTIYDADNSVIVALTGGDGYGVLGIASPEIASATTRRGSSRAGRSSAARSSTPPDRTGFGRRDPRIRPCHQSGAFADQRVLRRNGGYPDWGQPDGPEQAGPDQCGKVTGFPRPPRSRPCTR